MRARLLEEGPGRVFVLVFDSGDSVTEGLLEFAKRHDVSGASFTAIGAFRRATLAFFDVGSREYREIPIEEQAEVLALTGNFAVHGGEPRVHAHVVLGLRDGSTRGGHLLEATVRPTLEVVVTETPGRLRRTHDPETGLPLIDPDAEASGA